MGRREILLAVAITHLAVSVFSMRVALARRAAFDLPFFHGDPARMRGQSVLWGTALSEPVVMVAAESAGIALVALRPSPAAAALLAILGGCNIPGYLMERQVRRRLSPSGWDPAESPLILAGIASAAAMTAVARTELQAPR